MTNKEAIEVISMLFSDSTNEDYPFTEDFGTACTMAINALEERDRLEEMWLDDMNNPLEPIKLKSALDSELFKLNYRKENNPKEINILDYTIIYALIHCLEEMVGDGNEV